MEDRPFLYVYVWYGRFPNGALSADDPTYTLPRMIDDQISWPVSPSLSLYIIMPFDDDYHCHNGEWGTLPYLVLRFFIYIIYSLYLHLIALYDFPIRITFVLHIYISVYMARCRYQSINNACSHGFSQWL